MAARSDRTAHTRSTGASMLADTFRFSMTLTLPRVQQLQFNAPTPRPTVFVPLQATTSTQRAHGSFDGVGNGPDTGQVAPTDGRKQVRRLLAENPAGQYVDQNLALDGIG